MVGRRLKLKKILKIGIVCIIAIIAVGLAVYVNSRPVAAETLEVTPKTAELYFTIVGEAVADKSVSVYSSGAGKLLSVSVIKGQSVKEGDIICHIDPSDYINSIEQLESSIRGYQAEAKTRSSVQSLVVSSSEKNVQNERENLNRMKELYDNGAISKKVLDDTELGYENALKDLQQSREQLALTRNGGGDVAAVQVNKLQIDQLRQNIEDCVIKAPISGIITSLSVDETNLITYHMHIATIESEENIKIEVMVNTSDIDNIHLGDTVELALIRREGDKTFCGTVSEIDQNAQLKVTSKGNEERIIKVTVTPDQNGELKAGYDVDVKFCYYKEENQLTVPKSAVFEENGNSLVWIVRNGRIEKQAIQVKKMLRSEISVSGGINEDDVIIIDAGTDGLRAGKTII